MLVFVHRHQIVVIQSWFPSQRFPQRIIKLFTRNMSEHSIGAYKIIYREIEVQRFIIAVAQDAAKNFDELESKRL